MKPQYTWDPGLLLEYIENLGDNDGLDLKTLSLKLTALLMLLSGNRVHCVHSLSTEDMHRTAQVYTFYPTVLLKHSRTKFRGKPLTYKAYPHHKNLCVFTTLDAYINRTSTIKTSKALLVTHRRPHRKAHRDTVARWLKQILKDANIHDFTAHSFRAAGTSFAHKLAKLTVKDIMAQGQWTQETTWFRFYQKDIVNNVVRKDYGHQILDAYTSVRQEQ